MRWWRILLVVAAPACSLVVNLSDLAAPDASVSDVFAESPATESGAESGICDAAIDNNFPVICPDGGTLCVEGDGALSCSSSPTACNGGFVQCVTAAQCSGHACCLSGSVEPGCPYRVLTAQGLACEPVCPEGTYRICTSQSDCTPLTCVPWVIVPEGGTMTFTGGICI